VAYSPTLFKNILAVNISVHAISTD